MQRTLILAMLVASAPAFSNDVYPYGFEKEHAQSTLSRAQVVDNMRIPQPVSIRIDDQGRVRTQPSTKPRAQVVAETNEAARLGLLRWTEIGPVAATVEQERHIKQAGLQAIGQSVDIE